MYTLHRKSSIDSLCLFWRESESLTDNLDDLSQQHTVAHILLQVFNQPLVSRFGQVVVRPVSVDLSTRKEKSSLRNPSIKKSFTQLGFTTFMQARLTARGLSAASLALYSNPLHCALFKLFSTNNAQILPSDITEKPLHWGRRRETPRELKLNL